MTGIDIGRNIQTIIKEKGLLQRHVAEKAGFTPQQLCGMIKGRKLILAEYIPPLAEALGASVNELLTPNQPGT